MHVSIYCHNTADRSVQSIVIFLLFFFHIVLHCDSIVKPYFKLACLYPTGQCFQWKIYYSRNFIRIRQLSLDFCSRPTIESVLPYCNLRMLIAEQKLLHIS
jgi:hypothetical protein